ncbi:MAG TPA: class I SAM-dependent methyltransferase [Candidatus Baltobacteraceae bacterium]|nr:class I SAM-dependent methyltransferase [Candidatus Baltobacteraceae bacterium]
MTTFDSLAEYYDAGRIGYSNDLYNMLLGYGLAPTHHVLDVACGTGVASRPLIENGFRVTGVDVSEPMLTKARERLPAATWVAGAAEALPFAPDAFDAAISAQAFHHVDRAKAIEEIARVVKPGGIVGIWWKLLAGEDPVKQLRDRVAEQLRVDPPASGLTGGFKEFYGTQLLRNQQLRVVPWQVTVSLEGYLQYERSRKSVRDAFGPNAGRYFTALENGLREMIGSEPAPYLPLRYIQFLYMAKVA